MSMMYPNGSPQPTGVNQFMTGSQPNYGQGLVNFNQIPQALQQAAQRQQQQSQAGQVSAPSGPNSGGKAPQQPGGFDPASFAAGLRKFFTPGTQPAAAAPGGPAQPQMQPAGVGFGGPAMAGQTAPPIPSNSAAFGLGPLY
jgi:hypothetical protein